MAIAHRGGYFAESTSDGGGDARPADWGENSMRAFSAAVAFGYRYLETDVHATADGVLVAFHDDLLDRVSDSAGVIGELAYAQVAAARIRGELPIPTMEHLLTAFDDVETDPGHPARPVGACGPVRFNVDLKSDATVTPMARLVHRLGIGDRVCVASFSSPRLWRFRVLVRLGGTPPDRTRVATSAGPIGVAALRLLPAWVTRWCHSPGIAYQVPMTTTIAGRRIRLVTRGFVDRAHAIGKQVHVWTINDEQQMNELLDLGVDGIVTDTIDTLADVLIERARR